MMTSLISPISTIADAYLEQLDSADGVYRISENIDRTAKTLGYVAKSFFNRSSNVLGKTSKIFGTVCAVSDGVVGPILHVQYLWDKNGIRRDIQDKNIMNLSVNTGYAVLEGLCTLDLLSMMKVVNVGAFTGTVIPPVVALAFSIDLTATAVSFFSQKEVSHDDAKEYIEENKERFQKIDTENEKIKEAKRLLRGRKVRETAVKVAKLSLNIIFFTAITASALSAAVTIGTPVILTLGIAATFTALAHEILITKTVRSKLETPISNAKQS